MIPHIHDSSTRITKMLDGTIKDRVTDHQNRASSSKSKMPCHTHRINHHFSDKNASQTTCRYYLTHVPSPILDSFFPNLPLAPAADINFSTTNGHTAHSAQYKRKNRTARIRSSGEKDKESDPRFSGGFSASRIELASLSNTVFWLAKLDLGRTSCLYILSCSTPLRNLTTRNLKMPSPHTTRVRQFSAILDSISSAPTHSPHSSVEWVGLVVSCSGFLRNKLRGLQSKIGPFLNPSWPKSGENGKRVSKGGKNSRDRDSTTRQQSLWGNKLCSGVKAFTLGSHGTPICFLPQPMRHASTAITEICHVHAKIII